MAHQIDRLDKKILQMISQNARIPFLEVARECNVSGAAIHQRVQKLINIGVIKGSEFIIEVDAVIMAIGTRLNTLIHDTTENIEINKHGGIETVEETGETTREGIFAGGDAVTGAATVIKAMGAGKTAADNIDKYLQNK